MDETPDGSRPLKRHAALVSLSRDHHFALIHALALTRAAAQPAPPAPPGHGAVSVAESFLGFFHDELRGHMADEEEALLPLAGRASPDDGARLIAEHEDLRERVAVLRQVLEDGVDPRAVMKEIGERLHDHVRFEERIFFERIQVTLSEEQMGAVGESIERHRRSRGRGPGCALPLPGPIPPR